MIHTQLQFPYAKPRILSFEEAMAEFAKLLDYLRNLTPDPQANQPSRA